MYEDKHNTFILLLTLRNVFIIITQGLHSRNTVTTTKDLHYSTHLMKEATDVLCVTKNNVVLCGRSQCKVYVLVTI